MSFILRAYDVTVKGWVAKRFLAATAARARVRCWHAYSMVEDLSFGDFLRKTSIRRATNVPADFGVAVTIGGEAAYLTGEGGAGGHVAFVRPHCDQILFSHPLDVVR